MEQKIYLDCGVLGEEVLCTVLYTYFGAMPAVKEAGRDISPEEPESFEVSKIFTSDIVKHHTINLTGKYDNCPYFAEAVQSALREQI